MLLLLLYLHWFNNLLLSNKHANEDILILVLYNFTSSIFSRIYFFLILAGEIFLAAERVPRVGYRRRSHPSKTKRVLNGSDLFPLSPLPSPLSLSLSLKSGHRHEVSCVGYPTSTQKLLPAS